MPQDLQNELVKRHLMDMVPQDVRNTPTSQVYGMPGVVGVAAPEELIMMGNEFQPWAGAKNLMQMGRNAVNAVKGKLGMAVEEAPWQKLVPEPAAPLPAPQMPTQAPLRQPKPGGVLYDVLQRAAMKNGAGQANTPGEARLLQQFTPR